ncbi:MAG: response regulator [Deltaproteobacteria bacterium]|nr:response regulator [Deltaproteobacteria bacterium]
MAVITIFNGAFCRQEAVVREVIAATGYRMIGDGEIAATASRSSGMAEGKILRAFSAKTSVFNTFTHEKERSIAHLRLTLAELLSEEDLLIVGFAGQLIPREVSHVLRVCLIADLRFRVALAAQEQGLSEKESIGAVRRQDEDCALWVGALFRANDPWDPSLYDIMIPMDKTGVEEAAELIKENAAKDALQVTDRSKRAVEDFLLAARVEVALAEEGHTVEVSAGQGSVVLVINKHVLMLNRLEEELRSIAGKVPGVGSVETKVGPGYYQADIYRRHDFEMPSRVLLVDDEREFVQTLSERLLLRDMGSAVAYDGESALKLVSVEEPEVMILDLKMPGIDGIEVLRRVKQTNPEIEVIILTGHGSEQDREVCMKLGAFAYLQKPVDIDELSDTLKRANERIRRKKVSGV